MAEAGLQCGRDRAAARHLQRSSSCRSLGGAPHERHQKLGLGGASPVGLLPRRSFVNALQRVWAAGQRCGRGGRPMCCWWVGPLLLAGW